MSSKLKSISTLVTAHFFHADEEDDRTAGLIPPQVPSGPGSVRRRSDRVHAFSGSHCATRCRPGLMPHRASKR